MIVFLTLAILFGLCKGQEDDGSILDILEGESLTDEEITELESNVEETEVLEDPREVPESIDMTTLEQLELLNEYLQQEQSELELQIADANEKLNNYMADTEAVDLDLQEKITTLDAYNHNIIREDLQAQADALAAAEAAEDDDEEDEEEQIELSTSTIFLISLGFVFLLLHGVRNILGVSLHSFLNPVFYSLFIDVTILLIICTAASICYYVDAFESDAIDYSLMLIGIALFTFFWLLLGLWFIIAAQSFSLTWIKHEKACHDIRSLTHSFQEARIDVAGSVVPRRLKAIYNNLQYAIMRQLFICPTCLPPVTETYLRSDFNLAEYLSRSIADVIDKVFQLNWLGYSFIIVAMLVWRVIVSMDSQTQFIALWALPGSILLVSLSFILKLRKVYTKLVPQPVDQIVLNLPQDNVGRSPDLNEDIIPKPEYLSGRFYSKTQEIKYVNCCFYKVHPLKLTWSYIFANCYPNRHELLYWADRFGVDLTISVIQGLSICLTLWITIILLHYIPILHDTWEWIGIFMIVGCFIIWLFAAGYLLPEIIRLLTLTSKIEMKKDRKIIQDVILADRAEKAKIITRVYRQFKLIYRHKYGENPQVPDKVLEDFAGEVFNMYKDPDTGLLNIEDLEDAISLCGIRLEDDELRLFAKECKPDNNTDISKEAFCNATSVIMNSRNLNSDFVVKVVLTRYFQESCGKNVKDISLKEIKHFFEDFQWHFTNDDINDFLWEAKYILEDIGTMEITELAGMVKNSVKNYQC